MTAPMSRLDGKVVFLTGDASGIGAAIARRCIDESAWVICADQSPEGVLALAQSLGPRAFGIQ
ncbi:SDR family NAD(P)-dependent oxidoreductase, partial [Rhizobium brockwellii]|uniref:SDR family NAD(P)-dependent oxidoreductase n=1 Tax=Rhizobium brockwellii TaxID=3019932 RepID=UPI003F9AF2F3